VSCLIYIYIYIYIYIHTYIHTNAHAQSFVYMCVQCVHLQHTQCAIFTCIPLLHPVLTVRLRQRQASDQDSAALEARKVLQERIMLSTLLGEADDLGRSVVHLAASRGFNVLLEALLALPDADRVKVVRGVRLLSCVCVCVCACVCVACTLHLASGWRRSSVTCQRVPPCCPLYVGWKNRMPLLTQTSGSSIAFVDTDVR
jgi:hypothetical protein